MTAWKEAKRGKCPVCGHTVKLYPNRGTLRPHGFRMRRPTYRNGDTIGKWWSPCAGGGQKPGQVLSRQDSICPQCGGGDRLTADTGLCRKCQDTANAEAHGRRSRTVQPFVGHSGVGDR